MERIDELAINAGLGYYRLANPATSVQMPGFIVNFGGLLVREHDTLNQARFAHLVPDQSRRPFRIRIDQTLDHPRFGPTSR